MPVQVDDTASGVAFLEGFLLPAFDESTKCVLRMTRNGYSHDYELTYVSENVLETTEDVPSDLESIKLGGEGNLVRLQFGAPSALATNFKAMSLEHNGTLIYP